MYRIIGRIHETYHIFKEDVMKKENLITVGELEKKY